MLYKIALNEINKVVKNVMELKFVCLAFLRRHVHRYLLEILESIDFFFLVFFILLVGKKRFCQNKVSLL